MATLLPSTTESIAVSHPLPTSPPTSLASPHRPEGTGPARPAKQDTSLKSIASAGLHVSRSRDDDTADVESSPSMATLLAGSAGGADQDKEAERSRSSHVAREALGTTAEPSPSHATQASLPPSDQMQVDSQSGAGNHQHASDTYPPAEPAHAAGLINSSTVASPGPMDETASHHEGGGDHHHDHPHDRSTHPRDEIEDTQDSSNKAFSYPMPSGANLSDPRRGLSLPTAGFNKGSPRSPSSKKHRCPYCSTEFTRHHNLKSHLLTHSQEKPYVCQTCQSRFRRLHDLKRHSKLHTGERPHICPQCGRRFARGDALARHNKGQGGCAGRRASVGGYGPEDEYGDGSHPAGHHDDTMDGLVYAEPERMDEDEERPVNMPSIKKHGVPSEPLPRSTAAAAAAAAPYQPRQPSTYPPIAASRPSPGGLFPPTATHGGGSSASTSPVSPSGSLAFPPTGPPTSSSSVFHPAAVTESPKPLSPNTVSSHQLGHGPDSSGSGSGGGGGLHRAHSPSAGPQFPQPPSTFSRPGPPSSSLTNHVLPPPQPGAPHLPPPPGMSAKASSDPRYSGVGPTPPGPARHAPSHGHSGSHGGPPQASAPPPPPPSLNAPSGAGGHPAGVNGVDPAREDKLWAYILSVHEEVATLRSEVAALRTQLAAVQSNPNPSPGAGTSTSQT